MSSLRGRMLRVLGGTVLLCWVVALAGLAVHTGPGRNSPWDSKLQAIATKILLAIPSGFSDEDNEVGPRTPALQLRGSTFTKDELLTFQVWVRGRLIIRAPGAPLSALQPDFADGFFSNTVDGQRWRVYSISDSTGRVTVQVANLHSMIDAEVRNKSLILLAFTTTLMLLVGALMWWALRKSLAPLAAIEATVRARGVFDPEPLPVAELPTELQPLVVSFNHLLQQMHVAVEGERRFIGDAAHELRTPLAALLAQTQVALGAPTLDGKDAALRKLLAVAERSSRLSEQLLDLARLNAGAHAPHQTRADLAELLLHVVHEFDIQAQQTGRSVILSTAPCHVLGDVDEIGILLRNLVDNALRYTAPGGRVRVACQHIQRQSLQYVCLEVADDGPGVPVGEREAIFRRFHRLPGSNGRGSGIGLSLVQGIAELHGAIIETGEGLDGRGLGVRVMFPLPKEDAV